MKKLPPRYRGVTLVELLVGIGIMSMLFAILLPATGGMLTRSREAKCVSGLRQLQMANLAYASDNGGRFVPVFSNDSQAKSTWWFAVREYVTLLGRPTNQSASIPTQLRCPLAKVSGEPGWGYNSTGFSGGTSEPEFVRQATQALIARPSQTIAFVDALDRQVYSSSANKYQGSETKISHATAYRHGKDKNIANAVFWDGHVETLTRETLTGNQVRYFASFESNP